MGMRQVCSKVGGRQGLRDGIWGTRCGRSCLGVEMGTKGQACQHSGLCGQTNFVKKSQAGFGAACLQTGAQRDMCAPPCALAPSVFTSAHARASGWISMSIEHACVTSLDSGVKFCLCAVPLHAHTTP